MCSFPKMERHIFHNLVLDILVVLKTLAKSNTYNLVGKVNGQNTCIKKERHDRNLYRKGFQNALWHGTSAIHRPEELREIWNFMRLNHNVRLSTKSVSFASWFNVLSFNDKSERVIRLCGFLFNLAGHFSSQHNYPANEIKFGLTRGLFHSRALRWLQFPKGPIVLRLHPSNIHWP